jgi:hypothetical protein
MMKRKLLLALALAVLLCTIPVSADTEKTYVVAPSEYNWVEWDFHHTTRVAAKFRARGGSGNDIEVYIFDEEGFENWSNGHATKTYFNSGRVTVGHFDVRLATGKYFLVMSNKFSIVSNKVVTMTFVD